MKDFQVRVPIPCKEPQSVCVLWQSLEMGLVLWGQASFWSTFHEDAHSIFLLLP